MIRSFFLQTYRKFLRLTRKKQIFVVVWTVHLLLLCSLWVHHFAKRSFKPNMRIAIRTLEPKTVEPPKEMVVSAKKPEKPTPAKPPPAPAKKPLKPASIPSKPKKNKNALQEIKEALAELNQLEKPKPRALTLPSEIQITALDKETRVPQNYSEYLVAYLEESLDLPEYGSVKLSLRINRTGKLLHSEILSSENRKNSEFLKNRLPELLFPCFNDFGVEENALTFTLTFRNAEVR